MNTRKEFIRVLNEITEEYSLMINIVTDSLNGDFNIIPESRIIEAIEHFEIGLTLILDKKE